MRFSVFATATAALMLAQPASAAWKQYTYPELGFSVEFPADPTTKEGTYTTVLVKKASTHIVTLKQDDSLFTATVVDLMDRQDDGASLMGEAESMMDSLGETKSISSARVEPLKAAVYGHQITIDVTVEPGRGGGTLKWFKDTTGMEIPSGSRLTTNLFFTRGRLYIIQGINLPVPGGDLGRFNAVRFAQSLSFLTADGKPNVLGGR